MTSRMFLSTGQALLTLYEEHPSLRSADLLMLYFLGAKDTPSKTQIEKLIKDFDLPVSFADAIIDNDTTRRYFETQLAFETLQRSIKAISLVTLQDHYSKTLALLNPDIRVHFESLFVDINNAKNNMEKEYADCFTRIRTDEAYTQNFSVMDREKLLLIAKCSYLYVLNALHGKMPIDIYNQHMFAPNNKGKILKTDQTSVHSRFYGLMKSSMPVPRNDVCYSNSIFPLLRPADMSMYDSNAVWPRLNFAKLVHPYSNGISGTVLAMLRNFKYLSEQNQLAFNDKEKLSLYLKCFSSLLLFNSGGHTIHEFISTLKVKEVREAFSFIKDFDQIDEESIFFKDNRNAFNIAFRKTLVYHKTLQTRNQLLDELETNVSERLNICSRSTCG